MTAQTPGAPAPAVFQFQESYQLRVETDDSGEPLFCAKDVCAVLGYSNDRDAIARHCIAKGVVKRDTLTEGGTQQLTFISEGNLYRLIIKSNKPEAEPFETWVCDVVLPSIRKTGRYVHPAAIDPAAELITANDDKNIRRVIWDVERFLGYKSGWVQGCWFAIRRRLNWPSPQRFRVADLPEIGNELYRILNAAEKLRGFNRRLERDVLKHVIRGGGDIDALLAQEEAAYAKTLQDITAHAESVLSGWQLRELNAIADRTATAYSDNAEALENRP
jgi:prophage antirepressor-like protein